MCVQVASAGIKLQYMCTPGTLTYHLRNMTKNDDIEPVITTSRLTLQSASEPLHCIMMATPTLVYKLYNSGTINTINPTRTLAYLVIYLTVTGNSSCCAYFVVRQSQSVFLGCSVVMKLAFFRVFEDCVARHIIHEHSDVMKQKSVIVSVYCDSK